MSHKMAQSTVKLDEIDNKTKLKIYGYVRQCESEFTMTIPEIIKFVIMIYYWINEELG